ncbi:MAG: orotidine-5'-phosphate decarboxylase [Vicinamibacteria bacterium]|nr:orotidine-5'-phosphate decarboxylase [Vicinamibacteria bacterium]
MNIRLSPRERLIVALDVPGAEPAHALVARLAGRVGMFKVGHQLFTAAGPDLVRELTGAGHGVFLDLKYHDIPNTVEHAVAAAATLGCRLVNVHALGGRAMMAGAAKACAGSGAKLLAVTVLTSHDAASLREIGLPMAIPEAVRHLARLAQDAGADGVVASPEEIALIRAECGPAFLIVTPGIRLASSSRDDQARVATPAAALRAGADYLVVGRPITAGADPAAAADAIAAELERA